MKEPLTIQLESDSVTIGEYYSFVIPRIGEKINFRISMGFGDPNGKPLPYPNELAFIVEDVIYTALNAVKVEWWHTPTSGLTGGVQLIVTPLSKAAQGYVERVKLLSQ